MAVGAALHLIHPLGFEISEKACRRAGLDYWPRLDLREHESWEAYVASARPPRTWLFTTRGGRPYFDTGFAPGDHLVFGKETRGLPPSILEAAPDRCLFLPMAPGERSLNVATAVCAAVYEAVRQFRQAGRLEIGPDGRLAVGRARQADVPVGDSL